MAPLLGVFSLGGLAASLLVVYLFYVLGTLPPGCYGDLEVLPGVTMGYVRVLTSEYAYVPVPVLGRVPLDVAAAVWFVVNIGAALWLY
ncbi:MAG: VKOR family protein, partial [Pyrobaculum sp.]|nr:VKOR family protein [Pyrobaculum sp.]